jgi:hypothetical protein
MTEGTETAHSLVGSRAISAWMKERGFKTIASVKPSMNRWKEKSPLRLHFRLTNKLRLPDRYSSQPGYLGL